MNRSTREQFDRDAADHTVVPVWRVLVADTETPVSAFAKLAEDRDATLFESVEHGERWGRFSFIALDPFVTLRADGLSVQVTPPPRDDELVADLMAGVPTDSGILNALDVLLKRLSAPSYPGMPPFHGGVSGYLGYDVVREIERLPSTPHDDLGMPDAVMSVTRLVAAFDHFAQRLWLVDNVYVGTDPSAEMLDRLFDRSQRRLDDLAQRLKTSDTNTRLLEPPDGFEPVVPTSVSIPADQFRDAVEVAREYIAAGDIFQVVLSRRFEVELKVDPFEIYRSLRQVNPSPYMFFMRQKDAADVTLIGSSPEPMAQVIDGEAIIRPIAGTRFRGSNEDHDRRLAAELSEHPKERAEHVMLVDLARNDVGRIAEFGTQRMTELLTVERYSHVMHLTSEVRGRVRADATAVDVFRAAFPAGTVSGAPKVRAMEIIDEIEPVKRGPYGGVFGYFDFSGNLDTAIVIRTMVCTEGRGFVQAGAGVVVGSDPADEELETRNKANALLHAIGLAQTSGEIADRSS
ncbi:MAG: chorismate-binding protein [Acidimicrobiia bacterium]|jgi:anthranilate synthase component 1|nr:chorismate-binding protein [Acidimicrobiia bacterium]